jgi:glycosyltransferase involved in cell wall biosynthesis
MTPHTPRISIGLPVFNGEAFLKESVDSLLAQTFEDFELILSDNASTDQTPVICQAYAAADRRVRYVRNETNIGVYRNFNRVFQLSSGEYFKWAAADDVCHRDLLAKCLQVLESDSGVVAAYAKAKFMDQDRQQLNFKDPGWHLTSELPDERMRTVIFAGHWVNLFFGLIRSEQLAKTRLFPSYFSGDYRLLGELSLLGKFHEIPEYLFQRRIHPGASSQNRAVDWQSEFYRGSSGGIGLPLWQLCFDHFLSVARAPLDLSPKLSLVRAILVRMVLSYRRLLEELRMLVSYRVKQAITERTKTDAHR